MQTGDYYFFITIASVLGFVFPSLSPLSASRKTLSIIQDPIHRILAVKMDLVVVYRIWTLLLFSLTSSAVAFSPQIRIPASLPSPPPFSQQQLEQKQNDRRGSSFPQSRSQNKILKFSSTNTPHGAPITTDLTEDQV